MRVRCERHGCQSLGSALRRGDGGVQRVTEKYKIRRLSIFPGMASSVSRAALYALGPFFGNPIKPVLNYAFGDGYAKAYSHFRRDHNVSPGPRAGFDSDNLGLILPL